MLLPKSKKRYIGIQGFTLIELLVYMGLLVVISTASVSYLLSLDDLITQYQVETSLYRSSSNALEQIQAALRQADQFNSLQSSLGTGNGAVAVDINGVTTRFVRNGTAIDLYVGGTLLGNIIESDVSVLDFYVTQYTTGVGDMIRVSMALRSTRNGTTKTMTFYTSSVIRGDV